MIYVYYVALDYQLKVKQLNYNHAFFTLRYLALTKTSMIFKIVNCLRLKSTKPLIKNSGLFIIWESIINKYLYLLDKEVDFFVPNNNDISLISLFLGLLFFIWLSGMKFFDFRFFIFWMVIFNLGNKLDKFALLPWLKLVHLAVDVWPFCYSLHYLCFDIFFPSQLITMTYLSCSSLFCLPACLLVTIIGLFC